MTKPLVSICIPTYNGEKYLIECLDSCLNQTFKDYEIVICDDGSTDGSRALLEKYDKASDRIRFFENEKNLGLVGNWNKCLEVASGTWIKFVFQDDYITQNCLERFVSQITPAAQLIVSARNFILPENPSTDYVNYYTKEVRTLENTTTQKGPFFPPELISQIAVQNMSMNFIGEPSLTFFKKSLIAKSGPFNPALKQICDLEFVLRVSSERGLDYLPEKICAFRIHNDSTTNSNLEHKYFEMHYIEPLLFSWILLYDKAYKVFRSQLSIFLTIKLNLYFQVKCYTAYKVNQKEKREHDLFKESGSGFKEIDQYKKGTFLVRLLTRFIR